MSITINGKRVDIGGQAQLIGGNYNEAPKQGEVPPALVDPSLTALILECTDSIDWGVLFAHPLLLEWQGRQPNKPTSRQDGIEQALQFLSRYQGGVRRLLTALMENTHEDDLCHEKYRVKINKLTNGESSPF